jgi:hypothetical protein
MIGTASGIPAWVKGIMVARGTKGGAYRGEENLMMAVGITIINVNGTVMSDG